MAHERKVIGNAALIFGTVDIAGRVFGEVESGSIELTGDEEQVPDSIGGMQSILMLNDQYKVSLTTILPKTLALPKRGDLLSVPALNLGASIQGWKRVSGNKTSVKLEITACHWVSIGGSLETGPPVTNLDAGAPAGPPPAAED